MNPPQKKQSDFHNNPLLLHPTPSASADNIFLWVYISADTEFCQEKTQYLGYIGASRLDGNAQVSRALQPSSGEF
jgi:hypothetical protein